MEPQFTFLLTVMYDDHYAIKVAFIIEDANGVPSCIDLQYPMEPECLEWFGQFFKDGCPVVHAQPIDGFVHIDLSISKGITDAGN